MRVAVGLRLGLVLVAGASLVACGGPGASSPSAASLGGGGPTLERSPESGQVDRVGTSDGALKPDGVNDVALSCQVEGPATALFLAAVDEQGMPTGQFQADTLTGAAESPKEIGAQPGNGTPGIGVVESGKLLNLTDGSLPELGPGLHRLVLYVAPSPALHPGTRLRVYAQRPDKSVVAGGVVTP